MENLAADPTFQTGCSDQPETTNITNVDVGGNSGTQINRGAAEYEREATEKCGICLKNVNVNQMHQISFCHHRYCLSCMEKHVEAELLNHGIPRCPYVGCESKLAKVDCEKFLSSKWLEIYYKRLEEAEIPDSDKVYCPYSNCSALMALSELDRCPQPPASSSSHPSPTTAARKCQKCQRLFCIKCRVPWHMGMPCEDYASQSNGVDAELNLLAENNNLKRCPKCRHMIEHSEGCVHIVCRCDFEFCYKCGGEWLPLGHNEFISHLACEDDHGDYEDSDWDEDGDEDDNDNDHDHLDNEDKRQ